MNKEITKKLKNYSALAGAVAVAGSANAQINWGYNPNLIATVANNYVGLDLDTNGTVDFQFFVSSAMISTAWASNQYGTVTYFGAQGTNGGQMLRKFAQWQTPTSSSILSTTSSSTITRDFPLGFSSISTNPAAVSTNGNSNTSSYYFWGGTWNRIGQVAWAPGQTGVTSWGGVGSTQYAGQFLDDSDVQYMGLRVPSGGGYKYGWARIKITYGSSPGAGDQQLEVLEYGIQNTLDTPIKAGEGSALGVNDNTDESGVKVYSNNGNVFVDIENGGSGDVTVVNTTGTVVATSSLSGGASVVNLNGSTGLFIVNIETVSGTIAKRVAVN